MTHPAHRNSNVVYLRRPGQPAASPGHSETDDRADPSAKDHLFETSAFLSAYRRRSLRWLAISLLLSLAFHLAAAAMALSALSDRTNPRLAPTQPLQVSLAPPVKPEEAPPILMPSHAPKSPAEVRVPKPLPVLATAPRAVKPEFAVTAPTEKMQDIPAPQVHKTEAQAITLPVFAAAYLNNPPPAYPLSARRLGQEGLVLVHALISPAGRPEQVKLGTSSGVVSLDEAALNAVQRWSFIPARRGAEPVAAWVEVPIRFKLEQKD